MKELLPSTLAVQKLQNRFNLPVYLKTVLADVNTSPLTRHFADVGYMIRVYIDLAIARARLPA
jgi:hypothetical protein